MKRYPAIDESIKRKRTEHNERKIVRHSFSRFRSGLESSFLVMVQSKGGKRSAVGPFTQIKFGAIDGKEVHHDWEV